eukprot:1090322-Pelagomonas_calceolata.AAC.3
MQDINVRLLLIQSVIAMLCTIPHTVPVQNERGQAAPPFGLAIHLSAHTRTQVKKECNIKGKTAWVLWRTHFEIDEAYTPIKAIGKGAYGVVCSAKLKDKEKVAIKKIGGCYRVKVGEGSKCSADSHSCKS